MKLRYAGTCRLCGTSLSANQEAIYERTTKTVRCVECPTGIAVGLTAEVEVADAPNEPVVDVPVKASGDAGSSARREYERRKA